MIDDSELKIVRRRISMKIRQQMVLLFFVYGFIGGRGSISTVLSTGVCFIGGLAGVPKSGEGFEDPLGGLAGVPKSRVVEVDSGTTSDARILEGSISLILLSFSE
ncbi:MAG TPA: hypothetical protein VHA33_17500 [Candidatus Angelobacter sp.]|nr:hypothetical protein [Candidatus Angelobacter sp.]